MPAPPKRPVDAAVDVYDDGYLRVEHSKYYVACQGEPIYTLSRKEFLIFSRLVREIGRPVSPARVWRDVWGIRTKYSNETLKVHISHLRRKLAPFGINITTMPSVGYRLMEPQAKAKK